MKFCFILCPLSVTKASFCLLTVGEAFYFIAFCEMLTLYLTVLRRKNKYFVLLFYYIAISWIWNWFEDTEHCSYS